MSMYNSNLVAPIAVLEQSPEEAGLVDETQGRTWAISNTNTVIACTVRPLLLCAFVSYTQQGSYRATVPKVETGTKEG